MYSYISKMPKCLSKFSLTSIAAVLISSPAFAQTSFTLNQASSITNGLKICDSTDTYCIDIVADLTNPGARLPNASTAGSGSFNDRQLVSTEHTKLDYTVSSTNGVGGPAQPFRFNALSLLGINSLTEGSSSTRIRDAYTFIEGGAWRVDNPATGDIHAASVSINTAASDDVGSFVIPDAEGTNTLSLIGSFETATALGVGNSSEVLQNMAGGEDGHNVTYTFDTPQIDSASLIVFNSGGRRMGWGYNTLLQVDIFAPELTNTKSFGTPVMNADGTVEVPVTIMVENTGETLVNSLQVMDELSASTNFGSAFQSITVAPSISVIDDGNPETAVLPSSNASPFNGSSQPFFLDGSDGLLGIGDRLQISFSALLDPNANGAPATLQNMATALGTGPLGDSLSVESAPGTNTSGPTSLSLPDASPSLSMTKVADSQGPHNPGSIVTYTYTVTNDGDVNIDDVTVSDIHNGFGPLGAITLGTLTNTSGTSTDDGADAVFDALAPGDVINFTAEYVVTATDLGLGNSVTNTATAIGTPVAGTLSPASANESISLTGTPRPALNPGACGDFSREGFIINPGAPRTELGADFGSGATGITPFDPYVLEPLIGRNSATGVVNFYQTSADASASGSFLSNGIALRNADNIASTNAADSNHISEIWRVATRMEGVPGTTETLTIENSAAHEHSAYWQTDVNGAIINTNSSSNAGQDDGWIFGTNTTVVGADGTSYTIDVTYPADGIVILQFAILDSTGAFGGINIEDYECPAPSLSMTKVADSEGPHKAGDVVTYTYTITNDGNVNINDVAISDTHNGSDPAPTPGNETLLTDAGTQGDSTDATGDGTWDILAPEDTLTFTGSYTVTQADVDNL